MKSFLLIFASMLSSIAWANSNFVSNPYLPYPPGCAQVPEMDAQGRLGGTAKEVFAGTIGIVRPIGEAALPVGLKVYRTPCNEPNRSLIWVTFTLVGQPADENVDFSVPHISANVPGKGFGTGIRLATEPNGWGMLTESDRTDTHMAAVQHVLLAGYDPLPDNRKRRWLFLVDNRSPLSEWWTYDLNWLTASEYNGRLELIVTTFNNVDFETITIELPSTTELWPQPSKGLPLSGRLSGNWVIESAADQGVMLSVSGRMPSRPSEAEYPDRLPMVIFLTHYTFDIEGQMLWLTGAAQFEQGETQVTIPIEHVRDGEFRGGTAAQREVVGVVTITSNSCNDLTFEYDYNGAGLGTGQHRLQRLFSMETAGHDCRDFEARVEANNQ